MSSMQPRAVIFKTNTTLYQLRLGWQATYLIGLGLGLSQTKCNHQASIYQDGLGDLINADFHGARLNG